MLNLSLRYLKVQALVVGLLNVVTLARRTSPAAAAVFTENTPDSVIYTLPINEWTRSSLALPCQDHQRQRGAALPSAFRWQCLDLWV